MKSFVLYENGAIAEILCETSAHKGVRRVAEVIADDLFIVTGKKTGSFFNPDNCLSENVILFATLGHSPLVDTFAEKGLIDLSDLTGKRECYMMSVLDKPFPENPGIKQVLLITGSDKRGTIYGMFRLSELCGVSPLIFWGDAVPDKREAVIIKILNNTVSKEPSVKYRGFFINDEWPAFGKWCNEHYGGFTSKAYDKVFQLLLRLKGNYLWPAMWNSAFSKDGPDLENARLADEYGVIMGASHHEPMCRAGVEWQQEYSKYGKDNNWSFVTNAGAITEFWKDGILRNKDFENIITIGMRGEEDSKLLGEDATIEDNVKVLKDAIKTQNKLLREHINPDLSRVPRMFAIYKEVEDFYFGISGPAGLRGWKELDDVILLYSDDNHGNLRAIPQPKDKPHKGGYGIYYHFDYHGGPTSFEWLGHTNLVHAWEQLTTAYEHGIREMWIVNAGDIKGNEYPLSYFMDLAYDYDKWGISNINSAGEYTDAWVSMQFGPQLGITNKKSVIELLELYTMWNSVRIPESLNPDVFKSGFGEIEKTYETVSGIISRADALRSVLPETCLPAFDSMIYFPVMAFFSAMTVNLVAGMNHKHANRGTLIANHYAAMLQNAIPKDRLYVNKFHKFLGGKWNHMMESAHMCFRTWDDYDWAYPVIKNVAPIPYPKILVSFNGSQMYNIGHHWQIRRNISCTDFTRPDVDEVTIDIDSRGDVDFTYTVSCDKPWLSFSPQSGKSLLKDNPRKSITVKLDRGALKGVDCAVVRIDFSFINGAGTHVLLDVIAGCRGFSKYRGAFLESQGYICINAESFAEISDVKGDGWRVVPRLGREGSAVKCFPVTKNWEKAKNRPYVRYDFVTQQEGGYIVTFYISPRNPSVKGGTLKGCYGINDDAPVLFDVVSPDIVTNESDPEWSSGVTDNIRKLSFPAVFQQGKNSVKFYAADPGVILEHIVIYPKDSLIPETHLAPPVSYRIAKK